MTVACSMSNEMIYLLFEPVFQHTNSRSMCNHCSGGNVDDTRTFRNGTYIFVAIYDSDSVKVKSRNLPLILTFIDIRRCGKNANGPTLNASRNL